MTRHPGVELLIYLGIGWVLVAAFTGHPLALIGLGALWILGWRR